MEDDSKDKAGRPAGDRNSKNRSGEVLFDTQSFGIVYSMTLLPNGVSRVSVSRSAEKREQICRTPTTAKTRDVYKCLRHVVFFPFSILLSKKEYITIRDVVLAGKSFLFAVFASSFQVRPLGSGCMYVCIWNYDINSCYSLNSVRMDSTSVSLFRK